MMVPVPGSRLTGTAEIDEERAARFNVPDIRSPGQGDCRRAGSALTADDACFVRVGGDPVRSCRCDGGQPVAVQQAEGMGAHPPVALEPVRAAAIWAPARRPIRGTSRGRSRDWRACGGGRRRRHRTTRVLRSSRPGPWRRTPRAGLPRAAGQLPGRMVHQCPARAANRTGNPRGLAGWARRGRVGEDVLRDELGVIVAVVEVKADPAAVQGDPAAVIPGHRQQHCGIAAAGGVLWPGVSSKSSTSGLRSLTPASPNTDRTTALPACARRRSHSPLVNSPAVGIAGEEGKTSMSFDMNPSMTRAAVRPGAVPERRSAL